MLAMTTDKKTDLRLLCCRLVLGEARALSVEGPEYDDEISPPTLRGGTLSAAVVGLNGVLLLLYAGVSSSG